MVYSKLLQPARHQRYLQTTAVYYIAAIALAATIGLSFISLARLCTEACIEGHNYRLYGFTFETIGLILLPFTFTCHLLSKWYRWLINVTAFLLAGTLGAEVMFIYVQKYMIGSWCPICLTIAAAILCAALAYIYEFGHQCKQSIEREDRGYIMQNIFKGISAIIIFIAGFAFAFGGIGKYNALQAAESALVSKIAFGNTKSPVEVYIFTDWDCPACLSLEKVFETLAPKIMEHAKLIFVDDPVHPATLNYSPYNVAFMIHNKGQYMTLRSALGDLSQETKDPSLTQVQEIAKKHGVNFTQISYAEATMVAKYFDHLVDKLEVEGTPTVVVVSKSQKKGKKFEGTSEITEANILKAIKTMKSK